MNPLTDVLSLSHSYGSQRSDEPTDSDPQQPHGRKPAADDGEECLGERDRGAEQNRRQSQLDPGSHYEI